jgi:hypothetical protein
MINKNSLLMRIICDIFIEFLRKLEYNLFLKSFLKKDYLKWDTVMALIEMKKRLLVKWIVCL